MTDDDIFRWILIAGIVAVVPVAFYHRLKATTSEKLDRRQEGWLILLLLRPLGILGMLGFLAYLIDPAWMAWSSVPLLASVRWGGVALGIMAGFLLLWTFRNLGKNLTDTVVTRKEHSLVTTGPYRWVRHPFYVSFALAMLAYSLVTANWFIFVMGTAAFLLLVVRTKKEEQNLIERFGNAYRQYMETAGRFWPRFSPKRMHANECHLRIARPSDNLEAVVEFYRDGLGFTVLYKFTDHDGFDGVMLGHPGSAYHLEFTHKHGHTAGKAPTEDNLLVFYVPDADDWKRAVDQMERHGHRPVRSFNPYWDKNGKTFEDPDGYRVVLQHAAWPGNPGQFS